MNGMRGWDWVVGLLVAGWLGMPSAWAADAEATEVPGASVEVINESARAQILQAIDAESDPELKALMQEELSKLETGELSLRDLELGAPPLAGEQPGAGGLQTFADSLPRQGSLGLPVDGGGTTGDYLPPGAQQELEALLSQGTGDPNSQTDQALREEAEKIFEKYGIDPREFGPGPEGFEHEQGIDRAFEQMSPEAREQMEGLMQEHEGLEQPTRESETMMREYESTTQEAPLHEDEAPQQAYETPEAPQQEYQAPEQPEHEYQPPQYEYEPQPPQP